MAKIVVVVPTETMVSQAENVVAKYGIDATILRVTSATVLETVNQERRRGAEVVVARGNHANVLLRETDIPVIEIVMSGLNLALLFWQAKNMCNKPHPRIALVGFGNMFSEFKGFEQVLDIEVVSYLCRRHEDVLQAVEQAKAEHADIVIGGEMAVEHCTRIGMRHLFLSSTEDSVESAIKQARRVVYAIGLEKRRSAEIASMLDYSFDAVLRLDPEGTILNSNYMAEKVFRRPSVSIVGKKIGELLDLSAPDNPLSVAVKEQKSVYAYAVRAGEQALMANMAVINVEGDVNGYILTLQEYKKIEELEEQIRKDRYSRGYVAKMNFSELHTVSPVMNEVKQTAMKYARYDLPVLLIGETGVGKFALAECIHNFSLRNRNPFVSVDCSGLSETMQTRRFMGEDNAGGSRGAFRIAHTGTLLIEHVERLCEFCQYQLLYILKHKCISTLDGKSVLPVDIRLICTTNENLYDYVRDGAFLEPLYSLLSQLELVVPSLKERLEDLPDLVDMYMERYGLLYRKYVSLTPEASNLIYRQKWGGNVLQLSLFCEKLILLTDDKVIDEEFVRKYLPRSFNTTGKPEITESLPQEKEPVIVSNHEAAQLLQVLMKHQGNRTAAAEELGISKTTLWRKMKKYDLVKNAR